MLTQTTFNKLIRSLLILGLLFGVLQTSGVNSTPLPSEGNTRVIYLDVDYTIYEWWLLSWKTSQVVCQVYTENETAPTPGQVLYYCGADIQKQWLATGPCTYNDQVNSPQQCSGLYLHLSSATPAVKQVEIELPPAEMFISISGCDPKPPENRCVSLPYLRFEAVEPLPNERIIQIMGTVNDIPFTCPGDVCDLPLAPTGLNGIQVTFWAESSYGDVTKPYTAKVRVIPWGDFANPDVVSPDQPAYYVDVLSSQWRGPGTSSCAEIWRAFRPVAGPPAWLGTPDLAQDLVSTQEYYLLAGVLIKQGLVDVSACTDGGLQANGAASVCGMEAARPYVDAWQNQFNAEIIRVAQDTGIPAQMMRNIFSRESQFWPGIYDKVKEAGLGHLSDLGADAVLLWNTSFYDQFCPLVLSKETCQRGFGNLDKAHQEMLRGALVQKVNAACPDCPVGIDLTQANFSISIFARSMLANCEQVAQVVYNSTGKFAGEVASYEDLWKFTVLNYNAGSGCLANALQRTLYNQQPVTWQNVSANLEIGCLGGETYVNDVSYMPAPENPTVGDLIGTAVPGVVAPVTATPYVGGTPVPAVTTTATQVGYPAVTQTPTPPPSYPIETQPVSTGYPP